MLSRDDCSASRAVREVRFNACKYGDMEVLRSVLDPELSLVEHLNDKRPVGTAGRSLGELRKLYPPIKSGEDNQTELLFIHDVKPIKGSGMVETASLEHDYVNHFHLQKIEDARETDRKIHNSIR